MICSCDNDKRWDKDEENKCDYFDMSITDDNWL